MSKIFEGTKKITYILIVKVLPVESERANAPERLEDFVE